MKWNIAGLLLIVMLLSSLLSAIAITDTPHLQSAKTNIYQREPEQIRTQGAQPDIKVLNWFPLGWKDNNMYNSMDIAGPTFSLGIFHYYLIQVENDGPGHMNATVTIFFNGTQYFFGFLRYTDDSNTFSFLTLSGFGPYSYETDYIKYLQPGDTTNLHLFIFGIPIAGFAGASEPWNPTQMDLVQI